MFILFWWDRSLLITLEGLGAGHVAENLALAAQKQGRNHDTPPRDLQIGALGLEAC
jgi:hypothetical protein